EVLVVVVAGDGDDGAALEQEGLKDLLEVFDGVAQAVGTAQFAEQVAGDKQDVGLFLFGVEGDALDGPAQVGGAVDAAEAVAQVPVGGVEDFHNTPLSRRWQAASRSADACRTSRYNRLAGFYHLRKGESDADRQAAEGQRAGRQEKPCRPGSRTPRLW